MLLLLLACSAPQKTPAEDSGSIGPSIQYLSGQSTTTSPDGKTEWQTQEVLIRRTLSPSDNKIVEETWYDKEAGVTTLLRRPDSNVFDVGDNAQSFSGTVTFSGPDWAWTSWEYAVSMSDGSGRLVGTGQSDGESWTAEKMFEDLKEQPVAAIHDDFVFIEAGEFDEGLGAHY